MKPFRQITLLVFLVTLVVSSRSFLLPGAPETNNQQAETTGGLTGTGQLGEPYTTFPYAGTTVNIHRLPVRHNPHGHYHRNRLAQYQFEPVAILDRATVDSWYSGVNNQHVLGFQLHMWNETLRYAAATHLTQFTGHTVRPHQVQSIPFDKVILKTSGDNERWQTAQSWMPYTQTVAFTVACFDDCRQLAEEFKTDPAQHFSHFKLAYSTDGWRRTETKLIDVQSIAESSQLLNKISSRYLRSAEVLLTAADAQHLLWSAVSAIVHNNFQDEPDAVVTREAHKIIYDQLEKVVVAGKLSLAADDAKWSSVYWEDPLSRPDAVARSLNERHRRIHHQQDSAEEESNDWKEQTKQAVNELYEQHKEFVAFNGEKYLPKTTQVFRIKWNVIRERRIGLANIQVPYHPTADLTGPIIHEGPQYSMGLIIPSGINIFNN